MCYERTIIGSERKMEDNIKFLAPHLAATFVAWAGCARFQKSRKRFADVL